MKKADREKIFNKYDGRCAYCGCELTKGWHVDEIEPIRRNHKWKSERWRHNITGAVVELFNEQVLKNPEMWTHLPAKWIVDGCMHPDRLNIENQNPACASCNINKHSGSLEDFRKLIAGFMKHLNNVSTQYKIAKRYGLIKETNIEVKFYFETLNQ